MITIVETDRETWNRHWLEASQPPLTQSWEYGEAKARADHLRVGRFLIQCEGRPAALLQVLHRSLPVLGGVARINRGPVWLAESDAAAAGARDGRILQAIRRLALRRRWRYMRLAPNLPAGDLTDGLLGELGFRKREGAPYGSALVRIDRGPDLIRTGFHHEWERNLKKALSLGLEIAEPAIREGLAELEEEYQRLKEEKNFDGIPKALLDEMVAQHGPRWEAREFFACKDGRRVGGSLWIGHGDTFTYLVGWSSDEGRKLLSSYVLFWHAMMYYRNLGYRYFDVGGLDAATPKGVAQFKRHLKGESYTLAGEFTCFPLAPRILTRLFSPKREMAAQT
jgi:hypothetical protein